MSNMMLDDRFDTMPWDEIDAVVFDIGRVLVDMDPHEVLEHYCPGNEELISRALAKSTNTPYWNMFDRGDFTEEECAHAMAGHEEDLFEPILFLLREWPEYRYIVPEGVEALRACKAHGKKLYVLSNYPERHFRRNLTDYDFFSLFDGYVVSAIEHELKPDHRIYDLLTERFGLEKSRTLFIDDTPANVAAAMILGWQGICFKYPGQLKKFICD